MADPDSWHDMGAVVDDWMGEPAGGLCEVDDNLRALDTHADLFKIAQNRRSQLVCCFQLLVNLRYMLHRLCREGRRLHTCRDRLLDREVQLQHY